MALKRYDIIYADPSWTYRNKRTGGSMISGSESKYHVMSTKDICELPVRNLSARNSVLFLWATTPLKRDAFQVMDAWGYTYKTTIYWQKIMRLGMGFWFRGQVEELLLGVRGNVKAFRLQEPNFLQLKVLQHSEKPEEFRQLIERATAKMPSRERLEMFARRRVESWDAHGDEIDGGIDLDLYR